MHSSPLGRSRAKGFTLIEALIALMVLAFGMLAIAGFQTTLSRNSDVAKQRTEAMRLAQQKIEELRSYGQVPTSTASPHVFNYTDDVVSGCDESSPPTGTCSTLSFATNAHLKRTWTVTSNSTDTEKSVNVLVTWTDRAGESQSVQTMSVISKFDPSDIGTLATGPGGVNVRKPKNRNINVPYPAVTLDGGTTSAFQPGGAGGFYVFDNVTGNVIKSCTGGTAPTSEGQTLASTGATCTDIFAYLLSGYVRFDNSSNPSRNTVQNTTDTTLPLAASTPFSFDFSNYSPSVGGSPSTPQCFAQRQKVVSAGNQTAQSSITSAVRSSNVVTITTSSNHGLSVGEVISIREAQNSSFDGPFTITGTPSPTTFTYAQSGSNASSSGGEVNRVQEIVVAEGVTVPSVYNSVVSRYIAYACIISPVDHDGVASTAKRWWGKVTLNPNTDSSAGTTWSIGTTSDTNVYKVCRYSADYNVNGAISNGEHPLWYRAVTGALDSQNYVLIKGNNTCPTDTAADPTGSPATYANYSTVSHQPTGELSFQCANSACSGSNKVTLEPSTTSTDLNMD